jgi:DNA-binding transcriptional LysR family regulator
MNLQHLRYFLTTMETGSVSRAADALGITQPTLSVALKGVEREFGTRLFAPDGRGIKALPDAKLLEGRVRLALRTLSDAKRDLSGTKQAALKIGVLPSLAAAWLPALVRAWDGPVQIVEALTDELEKQVMSGTLDIALTALPAAGGLARKIILREPFMLFVGASHEMAGRRSVALTELDQQPFVLRQGCEQLGTSRRLLDAAHVRFKIVAKTRLESTAATLVAAGVGITFAPMSWQHPGVCAISVTGFPLERTVAVIWNTKANAKAAAGIAGKLEAQNIAALPAAN